jgi:hypothetical protein
MWLFVKSRKRRCRGEDWYLVVGINKPLPCRVVLVGSPPQKGGYLVRNWSVALAEARADRDRARVYLP